MKSSAGESVCPHTALPEQKTEPFLHSIYIQIECNYQIFPYDFKNQPSAFYALIFFPCFGTNFAYMQTEFIPCRTCVRLFSDIHQIENFPVKSAKIVYRYLKHFYTSAGQILTAE